MSLKKKLGLGIASAALGISLVGGGTFAYFNDVETTNNTFAAGELDLAVNPTTIIDVSNIKPGDWMNRSFTLKNDGSLDISKVLLTTNFPDTSNEFAKHIRVNFLKNEDKNGLFNPSNVITHKTLYELKTMTPDAVDNLSRLVFNEFLFGEEDGLKSGDSDELHVQFQFVDNGQDQNEFQNASLALTWKFDAKQTAGQSR
ncbi:TasA family protein [Cytobacillus oceanisediminis]|uniref:Cell division protein FtsN n=1 Tax=Cytobacillus oceanisediminis 2691 TaxID=1196031 RepID=A0A161JB75_9BACI|nr:TasA family protein [Cytobacillus oceanisediminis]AND38625.1 cell division protein FtsN [Cytobacillus oceanisediminis 2691]MBU8729986.1 M73 family metallopeptidase [Cytobacillus oceanisediminis]